MSKRINNLTEAIEDDDIYGEGIMPMTYSTINKLKKEGIIKDSDLIGKMLTSAKAKDLYKTNIRVHHKHYIPKDKKKYFYEEEITGGKINLGKAFKKFGSTMKHGLENIPKASILGIDAVKTGIESAGKQAIKGIQQGTEAVKDFGEQAVKEVGEYADVVLHGRNDYPPKVRELIKKYGEKKITRINIDRTPVPSVLTGALNAVSFGAFGKRFNRLPYDKLFHLRLDLTFEDGKTLAVEKNEVINMYESPKRLKGGEQKQIDIIPHELTLNKLLEGGQKIQGNKWFNYSAYNNNCQDFIVALLKGSNVGTEQDIAFTKQDTKSLFKGDSFLRKFANTVTDIGAKANEITTGAGLEDALLGFKDGSGEIQSIVFDKDNWTKAKAIKWLKKHGHTGLECDEKENTLRFRQIEPNKKYNYITKSLPNEIQLIIAYKKILTNNKYNKMPKKHSEYESSSSDSSDSDSDVEGRGFLREKKIIKKLKEIKREIEEHQNMHGGKIKIGKAFKKLGSTIKKGFEKEVMPIADKVGDYVTAKKGGLASDVIKYGIPATSSAVLGGLATLATGGNPVAGVAASALGSKLGAMGAKELQKKTGTGMKKRGRPPKKVSAQGDLIHIDIASHDDSPMKGDGLKEEVAKLRKEIKEAKKQSSKVKKMVGNQTITEAFNPSMSHLIANKEHRRGLAYTENIQDMTADILAMRKNMGIPDSAVQRRRGGGTTFAKEIKKIVPDLSLDEEGAYRETKKEIKHKGPKVTDQEHVLIEDKMKKASKKRVGGSGFKKGSPEAKEHMAKLRAMRKK